MMASGSLRSPPPRFPSVSGGSPPSAWSCDQMAFSHHPALLAGRVPVDVQASTGRPSESLVELEVNRVPVASRIGRRQGRGARWSAAAAAQRTAACRAGRPGRRSERTARRCRRGIAAAG